MENTNKAKVKFSYFIIIGLLLSNLFLGYLLYQNTKEYNEILLFKNNQIESTITSLDSISKELSNRIDTISVLKGNVDSLYIVKTQIEKEKAALLKSKNIAWGRVQKIQDKLNLYKRLLRKKDEDIKKLKNVNNYLLTENRGLKVQKEQLKDTISNLKVISQDLDSKVRVASKLVAKNIRLQAKNSRNKIREGRKFKTKHINTLVASFNIVKNDVASSGGKDIYLRIIDPQGSILISSNSNKNSFNYHGTTFFFTQTKKILFDNSEQLVSLEYIKNSEYEKGEYKVELYTFQGKMGQTTFTIY